MKKRGIVLFLLGILLISPFILAQEQSQTYSGFNRFIDNTRLFFSFGDNKVKLALEIREREVNSAIENNFNGNEEESDKNLENAWKKLQVIQEKVSLETADEVKESSNEVLNVIKQEGNLSEDFEVYSLEEEKTGLTAEWVIEINGKEGQTLSNEVVGNATGIQTRTVEIENRIDQIDGEISDWVVEHTYAEGTSAGGEAGIVIEGSEGGLAHVVKTEVAQGDNGLKPEVKTYVAGDGTMKDESVGESGGYAEGTTAGGSPDKNEVVEGDGGEWYAEGTTAEGTDAGGDGSIGSTEGTNDIAPAVESNEGDDSIVTGEIIREIKSSDNFIKKIFNWLF
ncbi:hypothetical protein M0R19_01715 [Candidatus Pacearchaeota archaeon]|nr:hypothetical protein [Candidatus Pacearchaeota archaeon]